MGLGKRLLKGLVKPLTNRRIMRSPDRVLLVADILPVFASLGGEILWVGVKRYTRDYPAILERRGAVCWTTDIDPKVARFGRKGRHVTADVTRIDEAFDAGRFGSVLCNGVFGWGVDGPEAQGRAFQAMGRLLRPGGLLLLGWNVGRMDDPMQGEGWRGWFEPDGFDTLPPRRRVDGTTHVYDLLRRLGG